MKNDYTRSRQIIAILSVLISLTIMINEEISIKIFATVFISGIALAASFLTTPISMQIIKAGDAIANKFLRILFYFVILPLTLLVAYSIYILIMLGYTQLTETVNTAVITMLLSIATTILVIVPYIQTLIVLILRRIRKD